MADLTTVFKTYITTLKTAAPTAQDVTTLVAKALPTVRASEAPHVDDANTMYLTYLT